jgi:rod shape-determining protein MreD
MRVKIPVYALCIFLIIVLQSTLVDYITIYNVKPNLLLVFIVSVALLRGSIEGAVVGFFAGLVQDMLFGKNIGFYALLGMYLGLVNGSINRRLYKESFAVAIFFTFVSTIAYEGLVYVLNSLKLIIEGQTNFIYALRGIILPEAFYNSFMTVFIYFFAIKMNYRFEKLDRITRNY